MNVLYAVGVLQKQDKKVFCNKAMVAELEEAFLELDDSNSSPGHNALEELKQDSDDKKRKECFRVGDHVAWLDKEEAEIMKKRIKDREFKI